MASKRRTERLLKKATEQYNKQQASNPFKSSPAANVQPTNTSTPVVAPPKPSMQPNNNRGGGGRTITPSQTEQPTPAMQVLTSAPKITEAAQGSGAIRDYQFQNRLNTDIVNLQQQQMQFYQQQYESGRIDYETANKKLNENVNRYVKSAYEQEGYTVKEAQEGLELERETPVNNTIFQKDLFGRDYIKPSTYEPIIKPKPEPMLKANPEWLIKRQEKGREESKERNETAQKAPSQFLGEKIAETKWFKKIEEKNEFVRTGNIYGKFNTEYQNPFKEEPTKEKVRYLAGNINFERTYTGISTINKGLFFSPALATGTQAVLQGQQAGVQEGMYEYFVKNGRRYRKNILTGKIEAEVPYFEIVGAYKPSTPSVSPATLEGGNLGRYVVKIGGKEYYVNSLGKLVRLNVPKVTNVNPFVAIKPVITAQSNLPSMVGGTGLKTIPTTSQGSKGVFDVVIELNRLPSEMKFAGALTGGSASLKTNTLGAIKENEFLTTKKLSTVAGSSLLLTPLISSKSWDNSNNAISPRMLQPSKVNEIQIQKPSQLSLQKSIQIIKPSQVLKTQMVFKQQYNPLSLEKLTPRTVQRTTFKPITFKFKLKEKSPAVEMKPRLTSQRRTLFESFLKRKGKDISLGKFGDIGTAKGRLVKELKGTLGASGFVTKENKAIPFKELNLGFEFTQSKKQPFRAVQKRGLRLSSRAEVSEIMSSKGRKVKWL